VSDRSGAENLGLMPADGKGDARQLSHGEETVFVSPAWAPDGSGIVVSRTGVTRNRLMELLLYPLDGSAPRTLVNGTREGITAVGAAFGADSQKVYFAQKPKSQQNYYPQIGQYQIAVLDRTSGELHPQTNTQGGGLRPVLSPDGRWLTLTLAGYEDAKVILTLDPIPARARPLLLRAVLGVMEKRQPAAKTATEITDR
jgi:Tol biopolymer transport system component